MGRENIDQKIMMVAVTTYLLLQIVINGLYWEEYTDDIVVMVMLLIGLILLMIFSYIGKILREPYLHTFILILIIITSFALKLSHDLGRLQARLRKNYTIVTYNKQKLVVISTYNGKLLTMPIDIQKKVISHKLIFISPDDLAAKNIPLEFTEVGRLTVAK
jgi:hypothetical protein